MVLSLQLLRRYKQHLANSVPNGSRSSELQGLILCCPLSIYTGFRKALHWREPKHFHSPHWLALDCDCGSMTQARHGGTGWDPPGTPDCSGDIRDTLAGMGSFGVGRSTEMAPLSREGTGPCRGYANACPGTNSTPFKICIYRIEWEMVGEGKKIRLQLGWKPLHPLVGKIKCKNRQMDTYVNVAVF